MSNSIHRDPATAWTFLCDHGGIELEGRDEGLDERIRGLLNPDASSLDDALDGATMEDFVRAFFEAAYPYIAMFRDILNFFEHADATQGQDEWTLRIDDIDMTLNHFQQWIKAWTEVARADLQVPALDSDGFNRMYTVIWERKKVYEVVQLNETHGLPGDVQAWVKAYENGLYEPLPESMMPQNCPSELQVSASVALAMNQRLLDLHLTRAQLKDLYDRRDRDRNRIMEIDRSDAFQIGMIAQNETDHMLRAFVVTLSAAATLLSEAELQNLGRDLDAITDGYPLMPFRATVSLSDLESVLSLPIWKKRYELYSVWIATEIIRSLGGHRVEIHHDKGRIAFAFKETLIATVHSSPGPFTLVSERRSSLVIPQETLIARKNSGEKVRTEGVQPDHGLWTVADGKEVCRMAVEVKHYKKSAKSRFVNVFEDYSRSLPLGEIYLVNHGPVGRTVYDVSKDVRARCHAIENLRSSNLKGREELARAVRKCVGDPIASWPDRTEDASSDTVLAFDVSGSMRDVMRSTAMNTFVRQVAAADLPQRLVAIDSGAVGSWAVSESGFAELLRVEGGGTALAGPILNLLKDYKSVVVVTDREGLSTLHGLNVAIHNTQPVAPPGVEVRLCHRPPESGGTPTP